MSAGRMIRRGHAVSGAQWCVHLELSDPTGAVVYRPELIDVMFRTAAEAEAAGWRLAEDWLHRYAMALGVDERTLLMRCTHQVAHCRTCKLSHVFVELTVELIEARFC